MGGCGVRINVVKGYKKSMGKRGLGCTKRRREAAVSRLDEDEQWEVYRSILRRVAQAARGFGSDKCAPNNHSCAGGAAQEGKC
jgi:hypothetical protein